MIPDFYTSHPEWPGRVEHIVELLGRVAATEELSGRTLELRRTNRLGAVHSSTAIEGNELTLSQVAEVVMQMDKSTQQNAALVEQMAAAASSLRSQAQDLVQTVAVFKLSWQ